MIIAPADLTPNSDRFGPLIDRRSVARGQGKNELQAALPSPTKRWRAWSPLSGDAGEELWGCGLQPLSRSAGEGGERSETDEGLTRAGCQSHLILIPEIPHLAR